MSPTTSNILGVIPARLASTRLPRKPLQLIAGKPLIQWVWDQATKVTRLTDLVIATDSEEIAEVVTAFGGKVVMTGEELSTGSERVREASRMLAVEKNVTWDLVANIQGDMPFLPPEVVDGTIGFFEQHSKRFGMVTVATPIIDEEIFRRNSVVKVVVTKEQAALYFSRAAIPHSRDGNYPDGSQLAFGSVSKGSTVFGYKHLGLYVYTPQALEAYNNSDQSPLEQVEKLEQLRVLERGFHIGVHIAEEKLLARSIEVDTPADLARACEIAGSL